MKLKLGWFKNSDGKPDGSWTLAVLSWMVVSFCLLVPLIETLTVKSFTLSLKPPDTTLLVAYLGTMTGNYLMRRNTKDKLNANSEVTQIDEEKK